MQLPVQHLTSGFRQDLFPLRVGVDRHQIISRMYPKDKDVFLSHVVLFVMQLLISAPVILND